jgi:hypothetical protein
MAPCATAPQDIKQQPVVVARVPGSITSLSWSSAGQGALLVGTAQGACYSLQPSAQAAPGLLMQAQQGALLGLAVAQGALATCCSDGSTCVWDMAVSERQSAAC